MNTLRGKEILPLRNGEKCHQSRERERTTVLGSELGREGLSRMQSSVYLFGSPVPQGSSRAFNRGGRIVITSDNKNLRKWRDYCQTVLRLKLAGDQPIDGPVEVLLDFYIERPKSHYNGSGTLRKGYTLAHISKPDTDKLVRAVLDSCTDAGVWHDDAQVVRLTASKNYATKANLPGVRVEVRKVVGND